MNSKDVKDARLVVDLTDVLDEFLISTTILQFVSADLLQGL